jgi:sulfhydrogenase subunit beta (sulfur reductase)
MKCIKIDKDAWTAGLARAADHYRLFGPVREAAHTAFAPLPPDRAPDMDIQNTRTSPRSVVYPQAEVMFNYTTDDNDPDAHVMKTPERDETPRAAVGIRPCDAYSFVLVRRNFDTPEYKDVYWLENLAGTTFVGLACENPCATCFCTSAGCGPYHEAGLDVLLLEDGDGYLARVLTDKGTDFVKAAGWEETTELSDADFEKRKAAAEAKIVSEVPTDRLSSTDTLALYDADFWDDVAFSCINCGTCTYLCPTCWCFDIQDETKGTDGIRYRCWDSCMFPLFTLHGSGHNPRGDKVQRVRQRFMHKLKYYLSQYGDGIQCVGCGRCVQYCPVNIDIRRVCGLMNDFGEAESCAVA